MIVAVVTPSMVSTDAVDNSVDAVGQWPWKPRRMCPCDKLVTK